MTAALTKPTRMGRQTDAAFRAAARKVFACDSYLNAKISDIAAEAGKSVASFYNYYPTKAALLIALTEDFHEEATELAVLPYRSGFPPARGAAGSRRRLLADLRKAPWRAHRRMPGQHGRD